MYPDGIRAAQAVLAGLGTYRGRIDGLIGPKTKAAAARAFDPPSWTPDRIVIGAAQTLLAAAGFDPGPIDGRWGPATDHARVLWQNIALPDRSGEEAAFGTEATMRAIFGPPGGPDCTAGRVSVPWRMRLAWQTEQRIKVIRCHRLVAPSAQRVVDAIWRAYAPEEIVDLGLDLFGGAFNHRPKRGGTSLSTHAWGVAIDFDPARNRLPWGADRARLAASDARAFWDAWEAEGWTSLGRARGYDWMHVQAPAN